MRINPLLLLGAQPFGAGGPERKVLLHNVRVLKHEGNDGTGVRKRDTREAVANFLDRGTVLKTVRNRVERDARAANSCGATDVDAKRNIVPSLPKSQQGDNVAPVKVPPDSLYVVGDNIDNSDDSRFYGPVPMSAVIARVRYVFWARDPSRIGQAL